DRDGRVGPRGLLRDDQARVLSGRNPLALGFPEPIERPPVAGVIPGPPELFEQSTLLRRQPRRRYDDHPDELIASPGPLEPRKAFPAQPKGRAGLDPGRDPQPACAIEGRDLDLRPQGGLGERDRQLIDDIVSVAGEPLVRTDMDGHVEVARCGACVPGEAATRDSKLDTVRDARRDFHSNRPLLRDSPLSGTSRTRALRPLSAAVAFRTRRDRDELAVASPLGVAHLAAAVARRAGDESLPFRPAPAARRTGHRVVDRDLLPTPSSDRLEAQLDLQPCVLAARRAPTSADRPADPAEELLEQRPAEAATAPEKRLEQVSSEDVLDVSRVGEARPVEALATPHLLFEAIRAELVVDLALLVVGQDLVRLGDLLELLLGGLRVVLVQVRMVLLREPPVRSLDLVLGRPARDAEPLVVVIVGHLALFPRDGPRSLLVHVLEVR